MHAAVCLLCASQPRCTGDAVKSGQFLGQFSWDRYVPTVVKGLIMEKMMMILGTNFLNF